VCLL